MIASEMIRALKKNFPDLDPQTTSEFYGRKQDVEGVWLRKAYMYNLTDYVLENDYDNVLTEFIRSKGWFVEPYDCETFMAYKG